jgi:peptidoglycan hydrolase-like protein with peptidoglycan-binding domain
MGPTRQARYLARPALAAVLAAGALVLAGCGGITLGGSQNAGATAGGQASASSTAPAPEPTSDAPAPEPTADAPTTTAPVTPSTTPTAKPSTPAAPKPTSTPTPTVKPTPKEGDTLHAGDSGPYVKSVQQKLSALGYWNGTPDGQYGDLTSQAVMALQKAAGLGRDGVFGPATRRALLAGVRPQSRMGGTGVEIDKARQLLLVVRGGAVTTIINTSTGSGQHYSYLGNDRIAVTPAGSYSVYRTVDHLDKGPLGDLWRPRYFNGGIAVHGAAYVPGYPASHGCARVSNPAMNMIWAGGLMPVGSRVVVY